MLNNETRRVRVAPMW